MFEILLGGNFTLFRRPVQCGQIFSEGINSIEMILYLLAFHKGVDFTLQAVELQGKKVSSLSVLRESSTGKTRSLANAALDILTILLLLLWVLISAQPPQNKEADVAH